MSHLHKEACGDHHSSSALPYGRSAVLGEDVPQALRGREVQDHTAGGVKRVDDDVDNIAPEVSRGLETNVSKQNCIRWRIKQRSGFTWRIIAWHPSVPPSPTPAPGVDVYRRENRKPEYAVREARMIRQPVVV